jgi:biotin synthase-related radical SAM superfamily protein
MAPLEIPRKKQEKIFLKALKPKSAEAIENVSERPSHRLRGRIKIADPAIIAEIAESDLLK